MRNFLVLCVAFLAAACGKESDTPGAERPDPPTFVATGNAPTPAIAVDFMTKYNSVAQAAIDRTPYKVKDSAEQSKEAQRMYKEDGDYLIRWVDAGDALFTAADDQTCKLYVHAVFSAWKEAYPLNGPPRAAEMKKKLEISKYANEMGGYCKDHMQLPSWAAGTK
ncbi:hypothetical protein [Burkholderia vietnamiensis]|uniref:hypothetical protein n=1 Tax=Burkholderia vietnamiensis TaxID=60552 RepID=UPI001CF18713|nr:hypothetical protein [Burkholderia vietnamiensis]MCA8194137.1 hypothetical protein [Burkholderia vietnamiensis]